MKTGIQLVICIGAAALMAAAETIAVLRRAPARPAQSAGSFSARFPPVLPDETNFGSVRGLQPVRMLGAGLAAEPASKEDPSRRGHHGRNAAFAQP